MQFDGLSGSYELIYLLLASAFLCEITDIPPLNPFSIIRYISTSDINSSSMPVIFRQPFHAKPGALCNSVPDPIYNIGGRFL